MAVVSTRWPATPSSPDLFTIISKVLYRPYLRLWSIQYIITSRVKLLSWHVICWWCTRRSCHQRFCHHCQVSAGAVNYWDVYAKVAAGHNLVGQFDRNESGSYPTAAAWSWGMLYIFARICQYFKRSDVWWADDFICNPIAAELDVPKLRSNKKGPPPKRSALIKKLAS